MVGAGVAGLAAARVLAMHFDQVLVVDRAPPARYFNDHPAARDTLFPHWLLPQGVAALEQLFPGLRADLREQGVPWSGTRSMRWFSNGGYHARHHRARSECLFLGRRLLLDALRARVAALPNVQIAGETRACGLLVEAGIAKVTGVRLVHRERAGPAQTLVCSLVVDAAGRTGNAVRWLRALDLPRPPESRIALPRHCLSRELLCDGVSRGLPLRMAFARNDDAAQGTLLAQEQGRWKIVLPVGRAMHGAPRESAFDTLISHLPDPGIRRLLAGASWIGPVQQCHSAGAVRRHFERMRHPLQGLLIMGKALTAADPYQGLDSSMEARHALLLAELMSAGPLDLREFHRHAANLSEPAWRLCAARAAAEHPPTQRRSLRQRLAQRYTTRVQRAAQRDAGVADALSRIALLEEPAAHLLNPALLARLLRLALSD